jgi:hypothetical protein
MSAIHANEFTEQLYKLAGKKIYIRDNADSYSGDKTERCYSIYDKKTNKKIIVFRARPLPGCCGVLVVYYLRPQGGTSAQGIQVFKSTLMSLIVPAAGNAKFGAVMLSQVDGSLGDSAMSISALSSNFVNHKTAHSVHIYCIHTVYIAPKTKPKFEEE